MEKIQRLEKYETEEIQRLETEEGYYRNNINHDEFVNNLELENEIKRLQKGKETEIPSQEEEQNTWDAISQYLKEQKELDEEYKKLKAGEKIPTFDIPTSSTTFVSPPIQPEIKQPKVIGHGEIIDFKPQMPTQIPTDTGHLPYIQIEDRRYNPYIPAPIQNVALEARPTQLVSTQPLEEKEEETVQHTRIIQEQPPQ